MVLEIRKIDNSWIDEFFEEAMDDLDSFFRLNWKHCRPTITIVPDRETINLLMGKKTEDWWGAWVNGRNIYILNEENYEEESSHRYSRKIYKALIKHELAHCFSNIIAKGSIRPLWLSEGISVFLSGQNKFKEKPIKYEKFINFYEKSGKGLYLESGFAVEFLVEKHGNEKLLELLRQSRKMESKKEFSDLFRSIYDFDLVYENFE
ncbi:MAG: hypothetical protein U9Q73_00895 [Nanoarchaeota archaeon]|nr:hypothetical protein [Nanoarchaeota archaeon]